MDQVKVALAWLKQHHFWVLSLLIVLTVLGVWYTASSSVASQTKSERSKIESEFSAVGSLISQPFKPNDEINAKQEAETKKLAADVLKEWNELYKDQKQKVLIWPPELGKKFIDAVKGSNFGDPISSPRREDYLNYVKLTFPSLVEIVDAELYPEDGAAGGGRARSGGREYSGRGGFDGGGGADGELESTHLVDWLDQGDLRARLVPQTTPSSIQIWALQEDLWVYRTLLEAIAETNKLTGASRSDRAAVQTIVEMKVGQSAAGNDALGRSLVPPDANEAAGGGGFDGGFGRSEYGGGGGFERGSEYGGSEGFTGRGMSEYGEAAEGVDPATALLANRYLDDTGKPITEVSADYTFGREFKRLPVRLVLEMDSKWLAPLMWQLANAPLQVEVEQVRFNPEGEGGRSTSSSGAGDTAAFDRRPTKGTVILQGIVYIFNKPDAAVVAAEPAE